MGEQSVLTAEVHSDVLRPRALCLEFFLVSQKLQDFLAHVSYLLALLDVSIEDQVVRELANIVLVVFHLVHEKPGAIDEQIIEELERLVMKTPTLLSKPSSSLYLCATFC